MIITYILLYYLWYMHTVIYEVSSYSFLYIYSTKINKKRVLSTFLRHTYHFTHIYIIHIILPYNELECSALIDWLSNFLC